MARGVRVWDLWVRAFHWIAVGCFAVSWWSAENGRMDLHYKSGLCMLALLAFRLILGLVGGDTARFASFVRSPGAVVRQLRGDRSQPSVGHSPLSALSVVAMLLSLAVQIGTGLFATDVDGLESGPLSFLVSFDTGRAAASWHDTSFNVLLALTGLHVAAVIFYLVARRRDYLTPMITGRDRQIDKALAEPRPSKPVASAFAAGVAVLLAWSVSSGLWL